MNIQHTGKRLRQLVAGAALLAAATTSIPAMANACTGYFNYTQQTYSTMVATRSLCSAHNTKANCDMARQALHAWMDAVSAHAACAANS